MAEDRWTEPVVVGVGETAATLRAVRWAADCAQRRGVGLRLVHAVEPAAEMAEHVRRWLAACRFAPTVPTTVASVTGSAGDVLAAASAHATVVVLGARGVGGFTGLLVGSTAVTLAGRAACPLVVMADAAAPPPDGPVLVGVDGTDVSDAAVAFAFVEAALRDVELHAVYAGRALDATEVVAARLAGCRARHPEVPVTTTVTDEAAAPALLARSGGAQLLVVGGHHRIGSWRRVLRSTGQQLLHESPCPVALVHRHHDIPFGPHRTVTEVPVVRDQSPCVPVCHGSSLKVWDPEERRTG